MATGKSDILGRVGAALANGRPEESTRNYAPRQCLQIFYRDGFLDRYSGDRLVHPGALRVLSMLRSSAKSNWRLEELGWHPVPPGDCREWDGMAGWFVGIVSAHPELLDGECVAKWLRAPIQVCADLQWPRFH